MKTKSGILALAPLVSKALPWQGLVMGTSTMSSRAETIARTISAGKMPRPIQARWTPPNRARNLVAKEHTARAAIRRTPSI